MGLIAINLPKCMLYTFAVWQVLCNAAKFQSRISFKLKDKTSHSHTEDRNDYCRFLPKGKKEMKVFAKQCFSFVVHPFNSKCKSVKVVTA